MAGEGWQVSYLGHNELTNTPITEAPLVGDDKERLGEMVAKATKDIRKTKDKVGMTLSFGLNGLNASPTAAGTPIYQPLSKIVYATYTKEKAVAKTAWIFSYVACDEDNRRGAPNCRYTCFSFKAKDEAEARGIVFATEKMIKTNTDRGRPQCPLAKMNASQLDDALMWWNDGKSQMYQYKSSRDGGEVTVAGVLKFRCQIDPAVKAISKMVRIASDVYGDELVKMLGDKFNIPDVSFAKYAVYQTQDDGEIHMLDETHNPISQSLLWQDPSEGTFSLKKLPNGLQRVGGDPRAETTESTDSKENTSNSTGTESSSAFMDDVLGPLLPFSEDDEDLLLSVMVSRQSGSGLGFKLTPSYLLQMCTAYSFLHQTNTAFSRFLTKMTTCIGTVMTDNPSNPDLLLFWTCNTMRLVDSFELRKDLQKAYKDAIGNTLENTLQIGIKMVSDCRDVMDLPPPGPLASVEWSSLEELQQIITEHYRSLDSNMSRANLQEVVERITAAMPSAHIRQKTLDLDNSMLNTSTTIDGPQTSTPSGKRAGADGETAKLAQERPGIDPLPAEWEELIDQETRHRFFANHITRQTSWTDPRDQLTTVTLTKEQGRGLGLGLSGAKRTWDDRLILGIFVSSLVQNSAAAMEGTLREGDEILEVNGHSLIGVSREGAIDFLKEIKFGDNVTLLVSQEPDEWIDPDREKAALRHTAL